VAEPKARKGLRGLSGGWKACGVFWKVLRNSKTTSGGGKLLKTSTDFELAE
jgi:hypothetical protein